MSTRFRSILGIGVLTLALGAPPGANGQPNPYNLKYNSGQTVQPIFEGWSHNPDGGFTMLFGYLNRNWVEEVLVPVGPDNGFEPGNVDAGQPTVFYPRVHRRLFSVNVPSDFGDAKLSWHLTVRGETLRAVGWLEPTWEIDPVYGGRTLSDEETRNTAPTIVVDVPSGVTVGQETRFTARVEDDGLPTPRDPEAAARPIGQENPPTLRAPDDAPESPNNVPAVPDRRSATAAPRIRGLRVSWTLWRGPASVSFEPGSTIAVEDAQAPMKATFTVPGDYVLRVEANDGRLTTEQELTVSVRSR